MSILVVGNATVDIFYEIKRLPSTGETLLASGRMVDAGGKGLNQAIAASRSGVVVDYVAPLGDDTAASVIRNRLASERLQTAELLIGPVPTDESIILVTPDGSNTIVSTNSAAKWLTVDTVARRLESVQANDTLLLQGNLSKETTEKCLEAAASAGARTVLNPSPIGFSYDDIWPLVSLAVVNEIEAVQLGNSEDPETAGRHLLKKRSRMMGLKVNRLDLIFLVLVCIRLHNHLHNLDGRQSKTLLADASPFHNHGRPFYNLCDFLDQILAATHNPLCPSHSH